MEVIFLRLSGSVPLGRGELQYAVSPFYHPWLGGGAVAVETLSLRWDEGPLSVLLGRFPLGFGEARLLPYTWQTPLPTGYQEGLSGLALTYYAPEYRIRAGYAADRGILVELSLRELKAYVLSGGLGLSMTASLGEVVVYGDVFAVGGGGQATVGITGFVGRGLLTLEARYPPALAAQGSWPWEDRTISVSGSWREQEVGLTVALATDRGTLELGVVENRVFLGLRLYRPLGDGSGREDSRTGFDRFPEPATMGPAR